MARKRSDNKKWKSRPSRRKAQKNRHTKPSSIRRNNSKLSRSTKPSRQRRKICKHNKYDPIVPLNIDTEPAEQIFDTQIVHDFLTER